jgi:hypothetical protein
MMLQVIDSESRQYFQDWPLHAIAPHRPPGQIEYPPVRFMALLKSSPIRDLDASALVAVLFQDRVWPAPDDEALRELEKLDWECLAADYEL